MKTFKNCENNYALLWYDMDAHHEAITKPISLVTELTSDVTLPSMRNHVMCRTILGGSHFKLRDRHTMVIIFWLQKDDNFEMKALYFLSSDL